MVVEKVELILVMSIIGIEVEAEWVAKETCASGDFGGSVPRILIDVVKCYLEGMLVFSR
jgi:hypothetical protein